MAFPKWQNPLDWLTQCWHIALARRVDPETDGWLIGPVGRVGETAGEFVERLAVEKQLRVVKNAPGAGLLQRFEGFNFAVDAAVADFYTRTINYTFEARSKWEPRFGLIGKIVSRFFSRRIHQFHLPRVGKDEKADFTSEIVQLVDHEGMAVDTVWVRSMRETGDIVFYGLYSTCRLPSGDSGVKAVFPLPTGSATVVFALRQGPNAGLQLYSSRKEHGDTGFFFFIVDRRGVVWKRYVAGLRQYIDVYSCGPNELGAQHEILLWTFKAYEMSYNIRRIQS